MRLQKQNTPWFELAAAQTRTRYTGEAEPFARTEQRVLESLSRKKRRSPVLWLVPVILIGSGSLAWAAEVERAVRWVVEEVQGLMPRSGTEAPAQPNAVAPALRAVAEAPQVPDTAEPPASAPSARTESAEVVDRAPRSSPTQSIARKAVEPPGPSVLPVPSDLERYRAGYEAHYERRDFDAALIAWDAYLREVRGGRFSPDVRYHRALALIELGRHSEALAALRPFATGAYGPQRQVSATKLMQRLEAELQTGAAEGDRANSP